MDSFDTVDSPTRGQNADLEEQQPSLDLPVCDHDVGTNDASAHLDDDPSPDEVPFEDGEDSLGPDDRWCHICKIPGGVSK